MGNFQGGGNRGGGFKGGSGGSRPPFKKSWGNDRGGDRGEVVMHKATCDECHKSCEVPFRPNGEKPVYCNDCFKGKRDDGDRGSSRPSFDNRGPKRDFNNDRSARPDFKSAPANDDTKKQLGEISTKLDRLIGAIEKLTETKKVAPAAKIAPAVAPKAEVKKSPIKAAKKAKVVAKKKK